MGGASTNKTDRHDIAEILLKVALNIIILNQTIQFNVACNTISTKYYAEKKGMSHISPQVMKEERRTVL
jgi:hypothetical protein